MTNEIEQEKTMNQIEEGKSKCKKPNKFEKLYEKEKSNKEYYQADGLLKHNIWYKINGTINHIVSAMEKWEKFAEEYIFLHNNQVRVWVFANKPNDNSWSVAKFLQEKYKISASRLSQLKLAYETKYRATLSQNLPYLTRMALSCDTLYLLGRIAKKNKVDVFEVYKSVKAQKGKVNQSTIKAWNKSTHKITSRSGINSAVNAISKVMRNIKNVEVSELKKLQKQCQAMLQKIDEAMLKAA